jgi:hypothetical protein
MNKSVVNKIIAGFASVVLMAGLTTAVVSSASASTSTNKNTASVSKTKDGFPSLKGKVKNMKGVWVEVNVWDSSSTNVVQDFAVTVKRGMKFPLKVRLDSHVDGKVVPQEWIVTKQNQRISVKGPEGLCTILNFKVADKNGKTGLSTSSSKFYDR